MTGFVSMTRKLLYVEGIQCKFMIDIVDIISNNVQINNVISSSERLSSDELLNAETKCYAVTMNVGVRLCVASCILLSFSHCSD